jgi:hypothetical protein
MEVKRPLAIGLCSITLLGASAATSRDVAAGFGERSDVSPYAGPVGGTIVHTAADGGFLTMDSRSPVRAYRGGAITADEAAHHAARLGNVTGL